MAIRKTLDFEKVFDILWYQENKFPQKKAANAFIKGKWESYAIDHIIEKANRVSSWLLDNGFMKGDRVAFVPLVGSPSWIIVDMACQQIGMVIVPVHANYPLKDTKFVLKETKAKLCITATSGLFYKIKGIQSDDERPFKLFHLEPEVEGYFSPLFPKSTQKIVHEKIEELRKSISKNDLLSIMYTSGTTGIPKGVMLSHANVVSNIKSMLTVLPLKPGNRVLSFLPVSHILERTTCFAYLAIGTEIYFNSSKDTLRHDFMTAKPVFCTAVPRTLEKMYDFVQEKRLEKNRLKRTIITWAIKVGEKYKDENKKNFLFGLKLFMARKLVLSKWKKMLGGHIRYIGVGAAALRTNISRLFSAGGVETLVGYGLTEASPYVSVNRTNPGQNKHGTVGVPISGVEVRINKPDVDGEGEIWVKGPNVMQGYYKRPDLTREALTQDGWLRTGDVGKYRKDRFLEITDRKKDIFKTSTGKYIAPQVLENHFVSSPFIVQCLVIGFRRPYVTALLVPNFSFLRAWCQEEGIHWTAPKYMVHNIKVVEKIQLEVNHLNEKLESHRKVRKITLCDKEWTVESSLLSVSLKLVRAPIEEKYHKEIEKMYLS